MSFETDYKNLAAEVSLAPIRQTRNGYTASMFGKSLSFDLRDGFPILTSRRIFIKGVLGEFAAMIRQPKSVSDFTKWGCNYWNAWADLDGNLAIDYGNAWFNFNGVNQIAALKHSLSNNPTDRRMIVSGWRPEKLDSLSLPCCHYSYQFYVHDNVLHMIWTQRSVDVMVGLPSDAVFAAVWLLTLANEFGMVAGSCKMDFGDTHIYANHFAGAINYINTVHCDPPSVYLDMEPGAPFETFEPSMLRLHNYKPKSTIKFELNV